MSLSMSGTPIIVTVSPDSAELTANGEVENGFCVGTFFFQMLKNTFVESLASIFCDWLFSLKRSQL